MALSNRAQSYKTLFTLSKQLFPHSTVATWAWKRDRYLRCSTTCPFYHPPPPIPPPTIRVHVLFVIAKLYPENFQPSRLILWTESVKTSRFETRKQKTTTTKNERKHHNSFLGCLIECHQKPFPIPFILLFHAQAYALRIPLYIIHNSHCFVPRKPIHSRRQKHFTKRFNVMKHLFRSTMNYMLDIGLLHKIIIVVLCLPIRASTAQPKKNFRVCIQKNKNPLKLFVFNDMMVLQLCNQSKAIYI